MAFGDTINLGIDDALQSIKNSAGIVSSVRNQTSGSSALPWSANGTTASNSVFFKPISIDPNRWNQVFPYRLMVIDVTKQNAVVGGNSFQGPPSVPIKGSFSQIIGFPEGTATLLFTPVVNNWIFNLPITPQQLSITDQFAINTAATLRGILEEHNGIKFKMINASGTMGVWPSRESVTQPPASPGILQSFFGGTLTAAGSLVSSISNVINSATTNSPNAKPTTILPQVSTAGPTSTGYYQALALQQFLEQYAEAKKDPKNAGWRLVFDIPKQNQSLIVTPMQYTWKQDASKPIECMFSFQLKAWRRIDITFAAVNSLPNISITPGLLQRVLNTLSTAQSACSAAINVIGAVRSDVDGIFNVLKQTALFVKGLAGIAVTAADLPSQIVQDFQSVISSFTALNSALLLSLNTDPATAKSINQISSVQQQNEGLSIGQVQSGQLGNNAIVSQSLNPSNAIFSNSNANFELMNLIPVSSLSLNLAQQNAVNNLIQTASETTVAQLKQYRNTILQLVLQLSNSFGTGSTEYSLVYNLPPPTPSISPITLDQYSLLETLYDVMQSYDSLTATQSIDDANIQSSMDYVAGLASNSGITFDSSISKILQPVPFGLTIEAIALRYLGDPQRWLEIATLNNLKEPYIDENGFQYSLLSNANGRQITIGNINNLFLGQVITLKSNTQIPTSRTILNIETLSSTSFLVTLDGLANLNNFVLADNAYVQAYLPGTVNSQQKIFIPTDLPVDENFDIVPPSSTISDPLTGLSKVDWLLTESGDIAVNNYGDVRYSYGLTNIIQALKIKLSTQQGKWLAHPEFGIDVRPGISTADLDMQKIYNNINNMITQDSRFQGVNSLQITLNGPTITIGLGVSIAGQSGVFPLTFVLK